MATRPSRKPKVPPSDPNEAAAAAVRALTGQDEDELTPQELRSQAARLLGALGAKKGGDARAKALSKKRLSEIARAGAKARWKDRKKG